MFTCGYQVHREVTRPGKSKHGHKTCKCADAMQRSERRGSQAHVAISHLQFRGIPTIPAGLAVLLRRHVGIRSELLNVTYVESSNINIRQLGSALGCLESAPVDTSELLETAIRAKRRKFLLATPFCL